jgi:hypothetical protein
LKTTVKHNLIIFHKPREFEELYSRMIEEYGRSTMIISWKLKRELGFTIRHHRGLAPNAVEDDRLTDEFRYKYHYEDQVHLDFYSEAAQTWFMLKYLNKT